MNICYVIAFATGKLVEEEGGSFALWLSYILTGVGANLVSWLILPRNTVSVGASGAVFGLFTISVLVKVSGIVFEFFFLDLCFQLFFQVLTVIKLDLDVLGLEEDP